MYVYLCNVLHSGLRADAHHKFEILAREGGVGTEEEHVGATEATAAEGVRGTEAAARGVGGGEQEACWVRGLAVSANQQVWGCGCGCGCKYTHTHTHTHTQTHTHTHTHTHTWRQAGRDRGKYEGEDCEATASRGIEKVLVPSSSRGVEGHGRERGREGVCVCVCVCVCSCVSAHTLVYA